MRALNNQLIQRLENVERLIGNTENKIKSE
jgi:hypothetical protein